MGLLNVAPFDAIGDTIRRKKTIMMDMFRHAEEILKAIDVLTELIISFSFAFSHDLSKPLTIIFPLHKGPTAGCPKNSSTPSTGRP